MPAKSFHIDNRLQNVGDIQRSYLWEVFFPNIENIIGSSFPSSNGTEGMSVRCRSMVLPGRGVEVIPTNFMGMRQFFAGRVNFSHQVNMLLEEFEDQGVMKAMYAWQQFMFDANPSNDATAGGSIANGKRGIKSVGGYAQDIILIMYKYDKTEQTNKITFKNAFPTMVSDVGLDYGSNDAVRFNVNFNYDYWVIS